MLIKKRKAVIKVNGIALFKKILNPFIKFLLLSSAIKEKVCLVECKKKNYIHFLYFDMKELVTFYLLL